MKIAIIVILILVLCCCFSVLTGVILFGNFALNGNCVWRGPLVDENSAVSECKKSIDLDDDVSDVDIEDDSLGLFEYSGIYSNEFRFEYDPSFTLSDDYSDNILLKLEIDNYIGTSDSFNIVKTDYSYMDYFDCYDYANEVYSTISNNDDSNFYSNTIEVGTNNVCELYYTFTSSNGVEIYQRQAVYQVESNNTDYILTETYVVGSENSLLLNDVYNSFEIL